MNRFEAEKELERLCNVAEAFLRYFNPAQLPSAKEDQWYSLFDTIERVRYKLKE